MKRYVSNRLPLWTIIALIMSIGCSHVLAAEFSADFTEQQGDYGKSGKIYVKGSNYCLDIIESGEQLLIIVNPEAKKTIVIPVSTKEYRELPIDDMTSIMNDSFQGYLYAAEMGEVKTAGTERPLMAMNAINR